MGYALSHTVTTNREDRTMAHTLRFKVELTDTFCGEANYSWVKREWFQLAEGMDKPATLKRMAKRAIGMSGVRGRWEEYDGELAFYPSGACMVLFVTFEGYR